MLLPLLPFSPLFISRRFHFSRRLRRCHRLRFQFHSHTRFLSAFRHADFRQRRFDAATLTPFSVFISFIFSDDYASLHAFFFSLFFADFRFHFFRHYFAAFGYFRHFRHAASSRVFELSAALMREAALAFSAAEMPPARPAPISSCQLSPYAADGCR
jgi:hypothetical protein